MSVKMFETKNNTFKVYMYIHCEDRHSEYGEYSTYTEALDDYENIIVTYC